MRKLFIVAFACLIVSAPVVSNAGFFDIFRSNQSAQVKTSATTTVGYRQGDKATVILDVQKALAAQKLYSGDLSGLIGPKTEAALKAWQKSHNLTVTGVLDISTINSILGRGGVGDLRDGGTPMPCAMAAPQVKVLSPNGGETYHPGEQITVTWATCNIPATENVTIVFNQFQPTNGSYSVIQTPNDGSEEITLEDASEFGTDPTDWTYGTNFKISVVWTGSIRDYSDNLFSIVEDLGGGGCESDDVELSILPTTPAGVQTNLNDFPVLEFKVENNSNCDVRLNGIRLAYMTTDILPYFEDISLREKDTMVNIWPSETFDLQQGEFINFSDNGTTPYIIPSGDEQELVVVLEGYIQQTQGILTYAEYSNKNMIFGFPKLNPLDVDFVYPEDAFGITLTGDKWGSVVKLPPTAF